MFVRLGIINSQGSVLESSVCILTGLYEYLLFFVPSSEYRGMTKVIH